MRINNKTFISEKLSIEIQNDLKMAAIKEARNFYLLINVGNVGRKLNRCLGI